MSSLQANEPAAVTISGNVVARNTALNLIGQAVPLLVGLLAIRITIHGLGPERFGVLTLVWAVVGYFGFLDLGLANATTKFGAEFVGRNELHLLPRLFWTSATSVAILGGSAAVAFAAIAPALAGRAFHLSPALADEARAALLIVSISLPILFATGVFRGMLAAFHRFDLINFVQIPASSASYIIPAVAASLGCRLPAIAAALVLARAAGAGAMLVLALRLLPDPFRSLAVDRRLLRQLFGYGGWVTLSGVINPFLAYLDRFLIGAFSSMLAVAQYAAPLDLALRMAVIPGSVSASIFPALSAFSGRGDKDRQRALLSRSATLLVLALAPVCLFVFAFARDVIGLWLGAGYVAASGPVLEIFALGLLVFSPALLAAATIQANGRPDLISKFYLVEVVFYVPLAWLLITRFGALGAAWAWAARGALDAGLLYFAAARLTGVRREATSARKLLPLSPALALAAFALLTAHSGAALLTRALLGVLVLTLYAISVWKLSLAGAERAMVTSKLRQVTGRAAPSAAPELDNL